jgi:hypothetical protein
MPDPRFKPLARHPELFFEGIFLNVTAPCYGARNNANTRG